MKNDLQFLIRIEVTAICLHESNIFDVIVFRNLSYVFIKSY